VREFAAWYPYSNVDVFIACAGIAGSSPVKYVDKGVEEVFATNHLGHALLFFLLNSRGLLVPDARIAIVGSSLHNPENKSRMKPSWTTADAVAHASDPEMQAAGITYPNSKLANTLFAYALTRRASAAGRKWAVNIYDPGFVPGGGSKLHRSEPAMR
jgi:NAD(P)-dependent dehydrogenase (short-subunit alcohol dehydrogenase family)